MSADALRLLDAVRCMDVSIRQGLGEAYLRNMRLARLAAARLIGGGV